MTQEIVVHLFVEYFSVIKEYNYEDYGRNMEILVINTKPLKNTKSHLHDNCNDVNVRYWKSLFCGRNLDNFTHSVYIRTQHCLYLYTHVHKGLFRSGGKEVHPSPCIKVTDSGITAFGLVPLGCGQPSVCQLLGRSWQCAAQICSGSRIDWQPQLVFL